MNRRDYIKIIGGIGVGTSLAGCSSFDDLQLTILVENEDGETISNANVEIIDEGGFLDGDDTLDSGTTNGNGEFVFTTDWDNDGEYRVVVEHDQYGQKKKNIQLDGTVEETFVLSPDLVLNVTNEQEQPVRTAEVAIIEEGGLLESDETIGEGITDESGKFTIPEIDDGEYRVVVEHEQYGQKSENIEIEGTIEETFVLSPDLVLTVTNEQGKPVGTAKVVIIDEGGLFESDETIKEGTTDESGKLTIPNIDDGSYLFEIRHQNHPDKTKEIDISDDSTGITISLPSPEPARFEFTEASSNKDTVERGEQIQIQISIKNTGGMEATKSIEFEFGGEVINTSDVTLEPDEETTRTHTVITEGYEEGEITYSFESDSDETQENLIIQSGELSDMEIMETMEETFELQGLELVDYGFESNEVHIHYETNATSGLEILTDMEIVAGAYLGGLDQGLSTERMVARMSEPGEEPVGIYTIETEWVEAHDEGEIDNEELLDRISETLEEI